MCCLDQMDSRARRMGFEKMSMEKMEKVSQGVKNKDVIPNHRDVHNRTQSHVPYDSITWINSCYARNALCPFLQTDVKLCYIVSPKRIQNCPCVVIYVGASSFCGVIG